MLKSLVIVGVLLVLASAALADMCDACKDMMFTADVGKCQMCKEEKTSSSSHKYCRDCAKKLGVCEHCGKKLAAESQPATKEGK